MAASSLITTLPVLSCLNLDATSAAQVSGGQIPPSRKYCNQLRFSLFGATVGVVAA